MKLTFRRSKKLGKKAFRLYFAQIWKILLMAELFKAGEHKTKTKLQSF